MKIKIKHGLSLLLCLLCLWSVVCLPSCSLIEDEAAMTINNVDISNDVYTYFLDLAVVELGIDAPFNALNDKASALASTYFKTNTLAHKEKISLSTAEKASVSEEVNAYWSLYGKYYSKIGVTKETLTKVFTADAYRDALLIHYYSTGGAEEIPVSRLYAEFRTKYIVFQAITGYLTRTNETGASVSIPENEKEALILKFQNMAAMVNAGEQDMEQAADFLSESGYQGSVQTVILHKDDTSYPAGFFKKVQGLEARRAKVIGTESFIFLVLRGDADVNSDYFREKTPEMIENIVGNEIDAKIEASLKAKTDINSSAARGYFSLIKNGKSE